MRALRLIPLIVAPAFALLATLGARPAHATRIGYRGAVLTRQQVERLLEPALRVPGDSIATASALGQMVAQLQDMGYLDARASARWDTMDREPRLALLVAEGPRRRWATIALDVPTREDSARFAEALTIRSGGWASPRAAGEAVAQALRAVVDRGWPYASLGVEGWEEDSSGVALRLSGALGPRVTITRVRIDGLRSTRVTVAQKAMGRLAGLPYNPSAALAARDRLAQLGLFQSVSFEGLEGETDWSQAELVYRVAEPRYNRFEGVIGAQGAAGTAGLVRLDLGNLAGTGRALGLNWESAGRNVSNFGARYAEPFVLGAPLRLEAAIDQQVQDTLWVRTRWGAGGKLAVSGRENVEARFDEERVVQSAGGVQEADIRTTTLAFERAAGGGVFERRGTRARLSAAQSFKTETLRPGGSQTARASAAGLEGDWNAPLAGRAALGLALRAAGKFSSQRVLPVYERYPLGGAATLRGFDEQAFLVDRYALTKVEWRWFLGEGPARAFLFWDHAWMATRRALPGPDEGGPGGDVLEHRQRDGVGFGLRLEAAGGLLGLDYGLEPGRPPFEGKVHLQLVSTF